MERERRGRQGSGQHGSLCPALSPCLTGAARVCGSWLQNYQRCTRGGPWAHRCRARKLPGAVRQLAAAKSRAPRSLKRLIQVGDTIVAILVGAFMGDTILVGAATLGGASLVVAILGGAMSRHSGRRHAGRRYSGLHHCSRRHSERSYSGRRYSGRRSGTPCVRTARLPAQTLGVSGHQVACAHVAGVGVCGGVPELHRLGDGSWREEVVGSVGGVCVGGVHARPRC